MLTEMICTFEKATLQVPIVSATYNHHYDASGDDQLQGSWQISHTAAASPCYEDPSVLLIHLYRELLVSAYGVYTFSSPFSRRRWRFDRYPYTRIYMSGDVSQLVCECCWV